MSRMRLRELKEKIAARAEERLHTVAVMIVSALRNDEFFAELPERWNTAKEEMKAHAD